MALKEYAGGAPATRLSGTLAAGTVTSFAVVTGGGAGYPTGATAPFVVVIDRNTATEEKILVNTRSGDTFGSGGTGLTRGYDNTSAQTHQAQAIVEHVYDALSATEASAHTNTTTRDDHTQYLKTDGTRAPTGISNIAAIAGASAPGDTAAKGSGPTLALSDHRHSREASPFPIWTGHTFAVAGNVAVPSGDIDFVNPLFVPVATGRVVKLAKCRYKINSGTSATCKLQINGVDATGFTGIVVTTTTAETNPTDILLADGDRIALVVTAVSGTPVNLSFTIVLEHTS